MEVIGNFIDLSDDSVIKLFGKEYMVAAKPVKTGTSIDNSDIIRALHKELKCDFGIVYPKEIASVLSQEKDQLVSRIYLTDRMFLKNIWNK